MNWYLQSGKESDVVTSTRIRFARNLPEFKFNLKEKRDIEKLKNKIKENTYAIGYGLKYLELKDIDDITKMSLVEKNLISPEYAMHNENGAILINDEENICIMINDEDHLKIQVFSSGLELENTLNYAIELDQKIEEVLGYATSKKYGYLTSMPTNCGTGLKASVMVHLPALAITKNINKVFYTINNFGVNIVGAYGESSKEYGEEAFQISSKRTLGVTEKEIVENIKVVTEKLIEQERKARKFLAKDTLDLEDTIYRSYGLLSNCRKISLEEAQKLISNVKLGTDLGVLSELNDSKVQQLILYTKPANMQKYLGEQYEALERDIKRAEVIKKIMSI